MSMTDNCNDCRGRESCPMESCLFPTDSYITDQQPRRDKETKRRDELKQQILKD